VLYFFEVACLFGCIFIAQFIRHSKLGRILVAMREKEDRVRFSGYSVANFKIFAFCVAAISPRSAAPCSRSTSASCRRPSSASCPR